MEIYGAKVNHMANPLGFSMERTVFSWKVRGARGKRQRDARVVVAADPELREIVFDSGFDAEASSLGYQAEFELRPRTRYYWNVTVRTDADEGCEDVLRGAVDEDCEQAAGEVQWFETAKMEEPWTGRWITCDSAETRHPYFEKAICPEGRVRRARLYICGLGLYEAYYNGQRIGNEYLTPYSNDYNAWVQYQTFDVTEAMQEAGTLSVLLGNGWYKARFGFEAKGEAGYYGDEWKLIAELQLEYEDGRTEVIGTDDSWTVRRSGITYSSLYDGEHFDARLEEEGNAARTASASTADGNAAQAASASTADGNAAQTASAGTADGNAVKTAFANMAEGNVTRADETDERHERASFTNAPKGKLTARRSLPVTVHEVFAPDRLLVTPKGEQVFDMGQEFTGIFELRVREPRGTRIHIQTGEILQDGCFYNANLRSAKSEYRYVSDGTERVIAPHFTFFGYRYVKVEGVTNLSCEDFRGLALYSDLEETGRIETGNTLLNRFISNVKWGLQSNFVDVPTDCPQRDERMGWTGDAQVFAPTATFLRDTYAFYAKYLYDMAEEQKEHDGMVPDVIPSAGVESCSSVWGDAAVIIPWNLYLFYGDRSILEDQYDSMKSWVDYIERIDGDAHAWREHFHYGDWLALDNMTSEEAVLGATDVGFISNLYYAVSAGLVAKAAEVLGNGADTARYDAEVSGNGADAERYGAEMSGNGADAERYRADVERYRALSEREFAALRREFYSATGRCCVKTQTALLLTLKYHLSSDEELTRRQLRALFRDRKDRLATGFVGTPLMNNILAENGMNDLAYHLLLNEDYPGWLREVKLGATTVWERWNSLLDDGTISGISMNSMNHYSYGSVEEWMFRHVAGINVWNYSDLFGTGAADTDAAAGRFVPGCRAVQLAPTLNWKVGSCAASYDSPSGLYRVKWELLDEEHVRIDVEVPFGCIAALYLPDAPEDVYCDRANPMFADVREIEADMLAGPQAREGTPARICRLEAGAYSVSYRTTRRIKPVYTFDTPIFELYEDAEAAEKLERIVPYEAIPKADQTNSFREMCERFKGYIPTEKQQAIKELLAEL